MVAKAKAVLGDKLPDTAGKSVAEVRRLTVAAKLGDAAVADKSDDYVEARFDGLTADSGNQHEPIRMPIVTGDARATYDAAAAKRKEALSNAWRAPEPAAATA